MTHILEDLTHTTEISWILGIRCISICKYIMLIIILEHFLKTKKVIWIKKNHYPLNFHPNYLLGSTWVPVTAQPNTFHRFGPARPMGADDSGVLGDGGVTGGAFTVRWNKMLMLNMMKCKKGQLMNIKWIIIYTIRLVILYDEKSSSYHKITTKIHVLISFLMLNTEKQGMLSCSNQR